MGRLGVFSELGNGEGFELADELTQSPVSGEEGPQRSACSWLSVRVT